MNEYKCKVVVPENDTKICFNVSGKTIKQAAEEIAVFAWLLGLMVDTDETFKDGFAVTLKDDIADVPLTIPRISYREWESGVTEYNFLTSAVTSYEIFGKNLNVHVEPSLMELARSEKTIDEYCKENMAQFDMAQFVQEKRHADFKQEKDQEDDE